MNKTKNFALNEHCFAASTPRCLVWDSQALFVEFGILLLK